MAKRIPSDGKKRPAGRGAGQAMQRPPIAGADSAEWLRITISSIGDGVITIDVGGRITFLNPAACALTGWALEDAVGLPIEEVFQIVRENSREVVENPAVRALRDGETVGLPNHTVLIRRDGTERPIDDSAAPIRIATAGAVGAVLIFRDATERREQERLVQDAAEYAQNILGTLRHPFLVLDQRLRVVSANRAFYVMFRAHKEATEGRFVYDLGDGQWSIPALRTLLEEILPQRHEFEDYEVEHDFPSGVGSRTMLLNARSIRSPGAHADLILLAIEDITARKRDEVLLASQRAVLELAAGGGNLAEVLSLVAQSAQRHSGERSRAAIFLVSPDGLALRFAASAGMSAEYTRSVDRFTVGPQSPSCGTAAFTGQMVVASDVTKDPLWVPFLELAREHDIRACWSQPIRTLGGKVLGTIALYHRNPCEPCSDDLEAVRLLASTAAIVIERQREKDQHGLAEAALRDSESRYRRLFETAKDGILILDAGTRKITDANAFMGGLTGLEPEELVGRELFEIGMFKDVEENKAAFEELQRTGYLRHDHLPVQNQHGEKVEVEFIANVYQEGERLVAQCNVRDISERIRLESEIARQAEVLAAQSRGKDEFLAMLSHELRNPLAPIRAAVHLLRLQERGTGNPIQHQAREIIERQVANLTRMVSDLLEVSRYVSGRIQLDLQPVDMRQVVEHALQSTESAFAQRRHAVFVSLCPEPVWIRADPTRIEEVLVNLLNNAAKYTPDGGRIEVWCERQETRGAGHSVVRVRDNGVGIEQELLPRIFDLFTQADRSLARSSGGLGIGLSLAQRLVALHSGTIEASSAGAGLGSEFTVRLPLVPVSDAIPRLMPGAEESLSGSRVRSGARAGPDGTPMRILIVDDNVDLVAMLSSTLSLKGYSVRGAYTGPNALVAAHEWRPHAVLLDIGLPGLDGYEVARRLRADPTFAGSDSLDGRGRGGGRLRLIALTGYGQDADIALARDAGFDGHLVKPCDFDRLERLMTTAESMQSAEWPGIRPVTRGVTT